MQGLFMDFVPHFYLHGRMAMLLLAAAITLWLRLPVLKFVRG